MAVTAAYSSSVKVSGTSTAMVGEACTLSGSDPTKRFTITAATKRVLDPTVAVVVKDGGSTVPAANYTLNYLMGYGTFVDYSPGGAVTIDASYLPMYAVAQCRSASYTVAAKELDASVFSSSLTSQQLVMGRFTASGSIELLDDFEVDYNTDVADTQSLLDDFLARTTKLLEVTIGSDTFRCWVLFPGLSEDASAEDLYKRKLDWKGAAPTSNVTDSFGFSWQ